MNEKSPVQELVAALTENMAATITALPQDGTPIAPIDQDIPDNTVQHTGKDKTTESDADELAATLKSPTTPSAELLLSLQQPLALGLTQATPPMPQSGQPDGNNTSPVTNPIQSFPTETAAAVVPPPAIQTLAQRNLPNFVNGKPNASKDAPLTTDTLQGPISLPKLKLPNLEPPPGLPQPLAHADTTPLAGSILQRNSSNHLSLPLSQPATSPSQGGANAGLNSLQSPLPGTGLGMAELSTDGLAMPVQPTPPTAMNAATIDYTATLGKIQSHLQAMGGTLESAQPPQTLLPKPQDVLNIPAKPEAVSLAQALHVPQTPNQEQQKGTPQVGNATTQPNTPTSPLPNVALDGISHTLLHGAAKLEGMKDPSDKPDDGLDTANATLQTGPTSDVADTSLPLGANGILSSSATGTHHTTNDAGPGGQIPQFSSTAAHPTEQVADGTVYSVKNGHKELIIRLNPDNLGEVRINLTSHGNQELSARMIATTKESHDLLKSQMDSLKQSLESQGIQVDRLSVVMAGSAESQSNTSHEHQHGFQHESFTQNTPNQSHTHHQDQQHHQSTFAQMHSQFQHKQGFAQSQFSRALNGNSSSATGDGISSEARHRPDTHHQDGNDNGRISILV
jgi:flagellar hook-length control protein FliK